MHDIDPTRDRMTGTPGVPGVPVVPATPAVDPTIGPVTAVGPVTVEGTTRHFSPLPYIAGLLLLVLGMWGLMSFSDKQDLGRTEEVAYVQQDLEVNSAPAAEGLRLDATSDRVAEDRVRDNLKDLRRDEMTASTEADRLGDNTASESTGAILAEQYEDGVASIDLADTTDTSSTADTAPSPGAAASSSDQQDAPQIAVVDLDYSQRDIPAMSEQALADEMTQLKADIDGSETTAFKVAQASGLEVLEERLGALEDRVDTTPMPMSEDARLKLTRQLQELRDELASFRKELAALVSAR